MSRKKAVTSLAIRCFYIEWIIIIITGWGRLLRYSHGTRTYWFRSKRQKGRDREKRNDNNVSKVWFYAPFDTIEFELIFDSVRFYNFNYNTRVVLWEKPMTELREKNDKRIDTYTLTATHRQIVFEVNEKKKLFLFCSCFVFSK